MYTQRIDRAVLAAAEKHAMLTPGDRVLCALSGGADSVCMTHALCRLSERLGIQVRAAHFSHGIRPQAAEGERRLCQALCQSLGIPLYTGEGDTLAFAARCKMGLEEAARTLRHDFLESTLTQWATGESGPSRDGHRRPRFVLATGHNLEDQAETVLINLVRGTGLQGLRGMEANTGSILRPLLGVSRQDIEGYVAEHGLSYATDETNAQNDYTRNKIRNQIMPLLQGINPRSGQNIARGAALAGQDLDYIRGQAQALMGELPPPCQQTTVFDAARLAAAHPAVAGRAVLMACQRQGLCGVSQRQVEAVLALARGESPSGQLCLPGLTVAWREYDKLYIEPKPQNAGYPAADFRAQTTWLELGQTAAWAGWAVEASAEHIEGAWYFDRQQVTFPVEIRQRRPGDRISLGNYHKSLKKLMIDEKIPKNLRDITPVLCDNNGVLCVGRLTADRGRARPGFEPGQTVSVRLVPPVDYT